MNARRWNRKWLVLAAAPLMVSAVLWKALHAPALEVETALIEYAPLRISIDEDGRTRTTNRYMVTASVHGRLQRMGVREGERISAGQVVAQIEPLPHDQPARVEAEARLRTAEARQRAAAAELAQAGALNEQAVRELARRRRLAEAGALSPEQIEQYETVARTRADDVRSARETVTMATAEVDAARQSLWSHTGQGRAAVQVLSPATGVVLRIPEYSSRTVAAGEPLLELGDVNTLEAVIDVLTADAVRIRPGMPAVLTGWGGDPLNGRVRKIEPSAFTRLSALGVEEQRVNVLIDFEHCPETLGDGYRIESSIVVWSAERALIVPAAALFRAADGWRVFVLNGGRAQLKTVQIGQRNNESGEVLAGLASGDRVILFPDDVLTNGARVKPAVRERQRK
jgi:HlyD family secretion protein